MANFLDELLKTLTIADFFDIALISVLIYAVLIWFKATASRFVLLGIFVLGVVYVAARFFHMYLSAVVLQGFFTILLIALVIIFQEELRRFFERISIWGSIRKRHEVFLGYPEIQSLTHALSELTRRRIGALIVIRGRDPLDRHVEGGVKLDGLLSESLLDSIFDPHSRGHDGAVIIERGRISKFGCHLPLSLDIEKVGDMGTRHSAIVGLAERCDAFCIAVSEERGTISLAREEKFVELKDPADLRGELMKFYLEKFPNPDQRTWGHWIRENSKEKALAIFLSCALWFVFVFQQGTLRRDFLVPIEYRNLASNWVLEEPKPKEATVTLVGRARAFDLLDPSTLKISLDMSGVIKEGTQKIFLSEDMIRGLSALSVAGVDPQEITLSAYQMISSNLPVEVRTNGKVPPGLILESIKASPDSIPVEIASKRLSGSLKAVTAPIDLASITETTTVTPKMAFPEGVKFADDKPPVVEVKVTVTKIQGQQPQEE